MSILKYFGIIIKTGKMVNTSLHCVNKTSHTVNHYSPEQGGIETLVMRLTFFTWRSTHVLVSSIFKQMKTFVDVPQQG